MKLKLAVAALWLGVATAGAQVSPDARWFTLRTKHFNVRFTPELEHEARRAAINAERAYAQLSAELVAPTGRVELVISDNVDFTNGYATIFPYNTIVIFAQPPIDAASLRNYNDWSQLVITHELTHIFHFDRARGVWNVGRNIFGRHPAFFPNAVTPSWMSEGLAVYYESRLTGSGRLEGSFHSMVARAAAVSGRIPTLPDLSRASTDFPGGEVVYVYGSLIFDYLSQTRGPRSIRNFIEESAAALPFFRGRAVRKAFGISFEDAWKHWSDSLLRVTPRNIAPMPSWRDLTPNARVTLFPRWKGDTLLTTLSDGRESLALYSILPDGRRRNLGRRNEIQANVVMPDGAILFAQPEYVNPYVIRSDLFLQRGDDQVQLTHGARLSTPDVSIRGRIIAVQAATGTTRLVLVSRDGKEINPLVESTVTEQWAEPRWSPNGRHFAAIRISRGGMSAIVVMDTLGKIIAQTDGASAVDATPSWSADGTSIYFSSDRDGAPQVYRWSPPEKVLRRISSAVTGLMSPEPSPDGKSLASVFYTGSGYHLGVAPLQARDVIGEMAAAPRRQTCPECVPESSRKTAPLEESSEPIRAYSAIETILPRYWEPVIFTTSEDGTEWGFATSGADVIGRHRYVAGTSIQTRYHQLAGYVSYRYAGLGVPLLDLVLDQSWDRGLVFSGTGVAPVARLDRRDRIAAARMTFVRPRYRSYGQASLGAEWELRDYSTVPDSVFRRLPESFQGTVRFPALSLSTSWNNAQRPTLSISREDGIALSGSVRQRWRQGHEGLSTRTMIGSIEAYKSLDLPGFAHHVIAARVAAGYADSRAISSLSVGGINGSSLDFVPGYPLGGSSRTFGVRGFSPSAQRGIRAIAGSVEYRFPIAAPGRGIDWLPIFLDRVSASAFADFGRAHCPAAALATAEACESGDVGNPWLGSVGGELNLDTGIPRDLPFRIRLGVAQPITAQEGHKKRPAFYLTAGSSF